MIDLSILWGVGTVLLLILLFVVFVRRRRRRLDARRRAAAASCRSPQKVNAGYPPMPAVRETMNDFPLD